MSQILWLHVITAISSRPGNPLGEEEPRFFVHLFDCILARGILSCKEKGLPKCIYFFLCGIDTSYLPLIIFFSLNLFNCLKLFLHILLYMASQIFVDMKVDKINWMKNVVYHRKKKQYKCLEAKWFKTSNRDSWDIHLYICEKIQWSNTLEARGDN